MRRAVARALAVAVLGAGTLLGTAAPAAAHPLGNFSVNTYSAVVVEPSAVRIDVVVDRAEIPTRQTYPSLDDESGVLPGATDVAVEQCAATAAGARLEIDGSATALRAVGSSLTFPPGAAGLRTARLVCRLSAQVPDLVGSRVRYALAPPAGTGWRETSAVGDGTRLVGSDVPERSVSDGLRTYPEDLLSSPLDVRAATFDVVPGGGTALGLGGLLEQGPLSAVPRGADRVTEAFTGLVARDALSAGFVTAALGLALLLGAAHAFAPGHGKTVMAAYLLGRGGAVRDAVLIGASVTVTHTLGVLALGVGLTALGLASPERLYPWLGLASGLLLVGIGVALLRAARHRRRALHPVTVEATRELVPAGAAAATVPHHPHDHPHHAHDHPNHGHDHPPHAHDHPNHGHDHPPHAHDHPHPHPLGPDQDHHAEPGEPHSHGLLTHSHPLPAEGSGLRGLLAVGFAGGMVPSPSALVVLLGGIALGRAWFGLVLVVAYGLGMAVALALTGVLLARGRDRLGLLLARARTSRGAGRAADALLALPVVAAAAVVLVGSGLAARAVGQLV